MPQIKIHDGEWQDWISQFVEQLCPHGQQNHGTNIIKQRNLCLVFTMQYEE